MRYKKSYLQTHDLDYFFIKDGKYCHAASAGGDLPASVNNVRILRNLQRLVHELPFLFKESEIIINRQRIIQLKGNKIIDFNITDYIDTFVQFARKGFYSYDRTNLEDIDSNQYHLVASPPYEIKVNLSIPEYNKFECDEM
jgi:hypothetical protein